MWIEKENTVSSTHLLDEMDTLIEDSVTHLDEYHDVDFDYSQNLLISQTTSSHTPYKPSPKKRGRK